MAYCGPRGIPLSTFLSWPLSDQDAALDWQAYEARRCRSCGTHPEEWDGDPFTAHAHLEQCQGCKAQGRLQGLPEADQRGAFAVIAAGSALDCLTCRPLDDD